MFLTCKFTKVLALFFAAVGNCHGATFNGILYSDESGPSGKGAGEIRLYVNLKVFEIHYRKPFSNEFAGPICYEPGAIWTVNTRSDADSNLEIVSATCAGQVDHTVHDAWLLVKSFLSELPLNAGKAVEMLSKKWQRSEEFHATQGMIATLRLDDYATFGRGGRCLAVISVTREGSVSVSAGDNCYLHSDHGPTTMRVEVARVPGAPKPLITKIELE
jgi:hypothetical protein